MIQICAFLENKGKWSIEVLVRREDTDTFTSGVIPITLKQKKMLDELYFGVKS